MAHNDDAVPAIPTPPVAIEPQPAAAPTVPAATSPYAPSAYPPPAYAPAPYGVAASPPQGLSIASLVCGIGGLLLTLVGFGFPASLAAVITGHLAAKRQPWARGMWLTGLITGYIGVALIVLVAVAALFIFGAFLLGFSAMGDASF
ncbi:MAG: DUF4190 domain-containing protein [Microbacteriaceae bacterium]